MLVSQLSSFFLRVKLSNDYESKHRSLISANMYFLLCFRIFTVTEVHLEKDFGFDTVKEIVILELVEGVMNTLQNNEVIDVGNVAEAYKVYMLQIFFTP